MKPSRTVARFFAVATLLGVLMLSAGTALHPMSADPNDAAAAFAEYALDRYWIWSHLAQFVGVVLLALALIAFTLELEEGHSAPWGGISVALAIGLIAVAAVGGRRSRPQAHGRPLGRRRGRTEVRCI
jgi:hypothetical protein